MTQFFGCFLQTLLYSFIYLLLKAWFLDEKTTLYMGFIDVLNSIVQIICEALVCLSIALSISLLQIIGGYLGGEKQQSV